MKCLYNFSVEEFNDFVESNKIDNWWIYDNSIEERHDAIFNKDYYNKLKKMAKQNDVSYNEGEIVSWIDGISMLYSSINYAIDDNDDSPLNSLRIIGELHIPFSNCRADSVLVMDNKILIIEFTFKNKYQNRKERYEEKLNQVIYYKELLSNALPKHIEIATYSFPIEVETDRYGKPEYVVSDIVKEKVYKNHDRCYYLARFINKFFKTTNKSAIDELNKLDDTIFKTKKVKRFS